MAAAGAVPGELPVEAIRPSPTNPRRTFNEEGLRALADSVAAVGVRQRLLVRPLRADGTPAPDAKGAAAFELVAGERRLRAAKLAGLARVPVDVCPLTDEQVLVIQLVENDQREDVRPSEQAAAYRRLADAGRTAERIAADTGHAAGYVRGLLRLGRLPAWALAAVDAGTLPRATAELVARVPGEAARARAAACVLLGYVRPGDLPDDFAEVVEEELRVPGGEPPLSYRDARDLVRNHFTKELKGSPFSLKVLYTIADTVGTGHERQLPSCDECPKRAGNDPEATAEGTRADVCLDPDCYRDKAEAYRAHEAARAAEKGVGLVAEPLRWPLLADQPPVGWLDPKAALKDCADLYRECAIAEGERHHAHKPLTEMLGRLCPPQRLCFDPRGKPRRVLKESEVRAALRDLGLIPKPEPRPKRAPSTGAGSEPARAAADPPTPGGRLVDKVSDWEVDERAAALAGGVLREYTADQCAALDGHEDAHEEGPVRAALELACRALCYDAALCREMPRGALIVRRFGERAADESGKRIDDAICRMRPSELVALLVEVAASMELGDGPNRATGQSLLAFAELDWEQLREQARRELSPPAPEPEPVPAHEVGAAELPPKVKEETAGAKKPKGKPARKAS